MMRINLNVRENLGLIFGFVFVVVTLLLWFVNLIYFLNSDFKEPYRSEIIRGLAVLIPVAALVTPFVDLEDGQ